MPKKKFTPNPKHVAEAETQNCKIFGRGRTSHFLNYTLPCGHNQEVQIGAMRVRNFICRTCLQTKTESKLAEHGCVILNSRAPISSKRSINVLMPCGHNKHMSSDQIRISQFKFCKKCAELKHQFEANLHDCKILGIGRNCFFRNYKLPCGHEQEITVSDMRKGEFRCHQCEDTYRTSKSCAYLLRITSGDFTWLKLGYTNLLMNRIIQYRLQEISQVEILSVCEFGSAVESHAFESSIHKLHKKHKLCPEVMKKYHRRNGFTECYPTYMQATLETIILAEASKQLEEI